MKIRFAIFALFATSLLAGCSTTGNVQSTVSNFDNSTTLSVEPKPTWCDKGLTPCTLVGATWNSVNPHGAFLDLQIQWEYVGINGVKINVDGQMFDAQPSTTLTQFSNQDPGSSWGQMLRHSDRSFLIPLDLLQKMAASNDVRLRVFTDKGYDDTVIADAQHNTPAHETLQKLIAELPAPKAQ